VAISATKRKKWNSFTRDVKDRIVRMAWEDRSEFDFIEEQFALTPNEVVQFMRTQLDEKAFKRWRKRATERGQLKHAALKTKEKSRFKCARQRSDGTTKGWK
jgi:uncharacterized protein (TIGR03643 family)